MVNYMKKGSGAVMYYIGCIWLVVVSIAFFIGLFQATTHIGKTRMLADIVADGSAYLGNNGWGIDEEVARDASVKLVEFNKEEFDDIKLDSLAFEKNETKGTFNGKNQNNTAVATTSLNTLINPAQTNLTKNNIVSKTRITYSGGMKIVWEAYTHSYEYTLSDTGQVHYVWGGGHGIPNDSNSWEVNADCSGFTSGVFRKCGYMIDSNSCTWDLEDVGIEIPSLEEALPGDIILYFPAGSGKAHGMSNHVTIYAGRWNGADWQVESTGSRSFTTANPGLGSQGYGGRFQHVRTNRPYMIRRIVDSEAQPEEVPLREHHMLSADQIATLTSVCIREQGDKPENIRACASFMCNLAEQRGYSNPYDYVMNSGWFGSQGLNAGAQGSYPSSEAERNIVYDAIVNGNRNLPPNVNEYDDPGDLVSVSNGGVEINKNDRYAYIPGKTILRNRWGAVYVFYCFPDGPEGIADPFGILTNYFQPGETTNDTSNTLSDNNTPTFTIPPDDYKHQDEEDNDDDDPEGLEDDEGTEGNGELVVPD